MTVSTLPTSQISERVGSEWRPSEAYSDASTQVHPLAHLSGDLRLQAGVAIALGATLQAASGATCRVGAGTLVQEGASVYALSQAKVLGDDRVPYTIWIGDRVTLTHKVLIQGPAYLGHDVFVGFRSTVFNARLGAGCMVMMHALVQDVDIPAGKLVPSGSVITRQAQADALPDVSPADRALGREILGHGNAPISVTSQPAWASLPPESPESNERDGLGTMQPQQLTPDVVQRVRQYLAQGLRIGTEHADQRRYRSNVWQTCSPIQSSREAEALAALEACLAEHAGEYVRMFGIDPRAKQRVAPVTIQRPDGRPVELNGAPTAATAPAAQAYRPAAGARAPLAPEVVQQVRQYLHQGYRIGAEHADVRRYRSGVWQTCPPITSSREGEVFAALEVCLASHAGEYVRVFGIDPKVKQRVAPITIQRPDGQRPSGLVSAPSQSQGGFGGGASSASYRGGAAPSLSGDLLQQVRQLIGQGYHIGAEHADQRRYRSNVWQTCSPITSTREGDVMAAIAKCVAEHPGEYVRIFGIEPAAKRRGPEITVQRPGEPAKAQGMASPGSFSAPSSVAASVSSNGSGGGNPLSPDLVQQVNQLVNQGYRLSVEYADQRRYRSNVWQTSAPLNGSRVSDILAALEGQLRQHQGEYVRLVGIDPRVKRRVLETTIQRP